MDQKAVEAGTAIRQKIQERPEIGLIFGSGLGELSDGLLNSVKIGYESIPHFPAATVEGHRGELISGAFGGINVFAFSGRIHYHEGYSMRQIVFPIRIMAEFNIRTVIITNAAGAINKSFQPGDLVAIEDHINLMGDNPLRGTKGFIDLTAAYCDKLRKTARMKADKLGFKLHSGVYAAMSGPAYETPAEIKALRNLGADMVGMSTVPEVIMANKLGMNVLGLSMITNMAAGLSGKPISHQDVLETSKNATRKFKDLINAVIEEIDL